VKEFGITRLSRARLIRPVDDLPAWSTVCVILRAGTAGRAWRQGVAAGRGGTTARGRGRLCDVARRPRRRGLPVDPPGRMDTTMAFVGTKAIFDRAGFRVVGTTIATASGMPRVIMRRIVTPDRTSGVTIR
jgi:hypothetical protein